MPPGPESNQPTESSSAPERTEQTDKVGSGDKGGAREDAASQVGSLNSQMREEKRAWEDANRPPSDLTRGRKYPSTKALLDQLGESFSQKDGTHPGKDLAAEAGKKTSLDAGEAKDSKAERAENKTDANVKAAADGIAPNPELDRQINQVGKHLKELANYVSPDVQNSVREFANGLTEFMKSFPPSSAVSLDRDPQTGDSRVTVLSDHGAKLSLPDGKGNLDIAESLSFNIGFDKDGPKLTNIDGLNAYVKALGGLPVAIKEAGPSIEDNQFGIKVKEAGPLGLEHTQFVPLAKMGGSSEAKASLDTQSEYSREKQAAPEPSVQELIEGLLDANRGNEESPTLSVVTAGEREVTEGTDTEAGKSPKLEAPPKAPDTTPEKDKGTVDKIKMPDGSERSFEHSPDGKVTKITESGGLVWSSKDGETFTQKGTGDTIKGKLSIEPDGTYKITNEKGVEYSRNSDGTTTISDQTGQLKVNLDGSRVLTDTKGNVTATMDVAGQQRTIERAENGEITKLTEPDKTQWVRGENNQWKNARTGEALDAELTVDKNGDFSFKRPDGRQTTQHLDGSSVATDAQGRVSAVLGPDGKVTEFEHDDKNNLVRMKNPDGTAWQKQGDHWQKEGSTETWKGERTVAKDGTIHQKSESGETVRRTDGWEERRDSKGDLQSIERDNPNGSHVTKDAQGHLAEVRDKNGNSFKVEYNKDGQPTSYEAPSGASWKSEDGLHWAKQGASPPENWTGRVLADENGNFREISQAGTERVHRGDGSYISATNGKITETVSSSGQVHKYGYDEKGNLNSVQYPNSNPPGSAWNTEDGKNWNKVDQDGNKVGEPWQGSIKLRADGTRAEFNEKTGNTTISRTDGSTVVRDSEGKLLKGTTAEGAVFDSKVGLTETKGKDGSHVMTDSQGHVTKVVGADGKTREYGYDQNGKLNHVVDSSGDWRTKNGVNWVKDNGKDTPPTTFKGTIEVQPDGTQKERSAETGAETYKKTDGKTVTVENGTTRVADKDGHILETVDKNGNKRQFEYNSEGKLSKTVEGNTVWTSANGVDWTNQEGAKRQGVSIVNPDGSTTDIDLKGHQTVRKLDGTATESERTDLAESAQVLRDTLALKGEKYNSKWSESDRIAEIRKQLEGRTAAETQVISSMFKDKWGDNSSMEDVFKNKLSGANADEAVNLLKREDGPDGKIKDDNAGKIHQAVIERGQWVDGRRDEAIEEDVRKRLSNMNSSQIADLKERYARRFGEDGGPAGKDLDSALANMEKSEFTKKSMEVYLKGKDSPTRDADMKELMDIAAKEKNLDHFKEAAGLASEKARQDFVNDDGSRKIVEAFRSINPLSKQNDITHAVEFVKDGKLSEATVIRDSTGTFSNKDKDIEDVLAKMPQERRELYMRGKYLSGHQDEIKTPQDKNAVGFYDNLHGAIKDTHAWGKEFKAAGLEDQVRFKGGSLMKDVSAQGGVLWASSNQEILSGIEKMDRGQWEKLTTQPGYADDLKKSMGDALGSGEKYKRASELIDQKIKMTDDLRNMSDSDLKKQPHFNKLKEEDFNSAVKGQKVAQQLEAEKDPTKRKELENTLKPEDKANLEKYRDASYNAVAAGARRSVIDALSDNVGTFKNDRRAMLDAIEHMTPAEQERFRKDQTDLKNKVREVLGAEGSAAHDAAMGMLKKVEKGEPPTMGITEKLNALAMDRSNKSEVIKELQGALKNDPKALEKLKSDPDFDKAVRRAIGDNEYLKNYDTFVKPMIEKGRLPAEAMLKLREHFDENGQPMIDRKSLAKDVLALPPDALKSLNKPENSAEKDLLLKSLNPEDAKLARNAIEQGGLKPEDKMRAFVLGSGSSKEEMKETLAHMKMEDRQKLFVDYSGKYGVELKRDLMQHADGEDKSEIDRLSRTHQVTAAQEFSLAIDKATRSDGYGGVVMDSLGFDGSRDRMKGSLTEFSKAMQDAAKDLPPEKQEELAKNFEKSLRSYQESKEEFANTVVDTAVMVGSMAAAPFTGGASLYPLLYGGMAAATLKVGTKAMVMGEDYDSTVSGISRDLATGFALGATSFLGPEHVGALLGVGGKAGAAAAEATIAQLAAKGLTREGEEFLSKSMKGLMRDALVNGVGGVEEQALAKLAGQMVEKGMIKEAHQAFMTEVMSTTLNKAIQDETTTWLKKEGLKYSMSALANATGNAATAVTDGIFTGDLSASTIGTQALQGGLSGLFMAHGSTKMDDYLKRKAVESPLAHSLGNVFAGAASSGLSTFAGAAITGDTVSAGDFMKATAQGGIGAARLEGAAWRLRPEHPHGPLPGDHTGSGISSRDSTTTPRDSATPRETTTPHEDSASRETPAKREPVERVTQNLEEQARTAQTEQVEGRRRVYTPEIQPPTTAVLEQVNRDVPHMSKPVAEDFSKRLAEVRERFTEDLTPTLKRADEQAPKVDNAHKVLEAEIADLKQKGISDSDIQAAKTNKDHPLNKESDLYNKHEDWKHQADEHAQLTSHMKEVAEQRRAQLQEELNRFTSENKLPKLDLTTVENSHTAGGYHSGEGKITIPKVDLLAAGGGDGLSKTLFHEMVHAVGQDSDVVRLSIRETTADGKPMDPEAVRKHYKESTGSDLSKEWLDRVVDASKDKPPLTADQVTRLKELASELKTVESVGEKSKDLLDSARTIESRLKRLDANIMDDAANRLLKELTDPAGGEHLQKRLFGDKPITQELLDQVDRWESSSGFDGKKTRDLLINLLEQRLKEVNTEHKAVIDAYANKRLEREAYGLEHHVQEPSELRQSVAGSQPNERAITPHGQLGQTTDTQSPLIADQAQARPGHLERLSDSGASHDDSSPHRHIPEEAPRIRTREQPEHPPELVRQSSEMTLANGEKLAIDNPTTAGIEKLSVKELEAIYQKNNERLEQIFRTNFEQIPKNMGFHGAEQKSSYDVIKGQNFGGGLYMWGYESGTPETLKQQFTQAVDNAYQWSQRSRFNPQHEDGPIFVGAVNDKYTSHSSRNLGCVETVLDNIPRDQLPSVIHGCIPQSTGNEYKAMPQIYDAERIAASGMSAPEYLRVAREHNEKAPVAERLKVQALVVEALKMSGAFENPAIAQQGADKIYNATHRVAKNDYEAIHEVLDGASRSQIKSIDEAFKKQYGQSLEDRLKQTVWDAGEMQKIQDLLNPKMTTYCWPKGHPEGQSTAVTEGASHSKTREREALAERAGGGTERPSSGDSSVDKPATVKLDQVAAPRAGELKRGSEVEFNGETHTIAGFDTKSGDVVLKQQHHDDDLQVRAAPPNVESDPGFGKVKVGEHTFYHDRSDPDGKVYSVLKSPTGTDVLLLEPGYKVVKREQVSVLDDHGPPPDKPTEIFVNGKKVQLTDGEVTVGRSHQKNALNDALHPSVSRDHLVVRQDSEGRTFIKDISRDGTFRQKEDGSWERLEKGKEVLLKPTDTVRMGSPNGPELNLKERAPEIYLNGQKVEATGNEVIIGRDHQKDVLKGLLHSTVSREHLVLRQDAQGQLFVKDISKGGTYKQASDGSWERLPRGQEVAVSPTDVLRLGGKDGAELCLSERPPVVEKAPLPVVAPAAEQPMKAGCKVEFEGNKYFVSGFDKNTGDIILCRPGHGADFVDRPRELTSEFTPVKVGKETYYRNPEGAMFKLKGPEGQQSLVQDHEMRIVSRDRITEIARLKTETPAAGDVRPLTPEQLRRRNDGEYLTMFFRRETAAEPDAVRQSNEMARKHQISEKLVDGFQLCTAEGVGIGGDGRSRQKHSPDIVLDRTQDRILNRYIAEAHRQFDHLKNDPQALAAELTKFAKKVMHPDGWTERKLDDAYGEFNKEFAGKRMLLGEVINRSQKGEYGGVCAQQAMLLKVLGDSFGLETRLVYGHYKETKNLPSNPSCNHAWTEMNIDGKWLIFDPRQRRHGQPLDGHPTHFHLPDRPQVTNVQDLVPIKDKQAKPKSGEQAEHERSVLAESRAPEHSRPGIGGKPEIPTDLGLRIDVNDKVRFLDKDGWKVTGFNEKTGNLELTRDNTRRMPAKDFVELNPNQRYRPGQEYTATDLITGKTEPGWTLVGKDKDGNALLVKKDGLKVEASPEEIRNENPSLVQPIPVVLDSLDRSQSKLQDGQLSLDKVLLGTVGSRNPISEGKVTNADGSTTDVIVHRFGGEGDSAQRSAERMRKELAAYKLNQLLGFDNGFPPTAPIGKDQVVTHKGQQQDGVEGWIQKKNGDQFEREMQNLAHQKLGRHGHQAVSELVKNDPQLRKQIEQAFVERLIYGDRDSLSTNFVVVNESGQTRVRNIDLQEAFGQHRIPDWQALPKHGINERLHRDFSDKPLSSDVREQIQKFVDTWNTEAGRKELADSLNLSSDEVGAMLARAEWLADKGRFPRAETQKQLLEKAAAQKKLEENKTLYGRFKNAVKRWLGHDD